MRQKLVALIVLSLISLGFVAHGFAETPEEVLKRLFPKLQFDAVGPSSIKGLYEVVLGGDVAYFNPEEGYLLIGEIIDKNQVNITAKKRADLAAKRNEGALAKAKTLPLEKAVKVGSGPNKVIEFTDPDCPYCRRAAEFFDKRTDVTRYVFFLPLAMHKDAENKVKFVLCSSDRAKTYEEAMHGKLDDQKYKVCAKPEVDELAKLHKELAAAMGVTATPFFVVNDKIVPGANIPMIEGALVK